MAYPWALSVLDSKMAAFAGIVTDKYNMKLLFVISKRGCPHALSIDMAAVKALGWRILKRVEHVTEMLPVNKINCLLS